MKPSEKAEPITPIRPARLSGGVMSAMQPCRVEMLPAKKPPANRATKASQMLGAKASAT